MDNPLRLFLVDEGAQTLVFTRELLEGLDEAAILAAFGSTGRWVTVTFHEPTFGRQEQAKRAALIKDPALGFVIDPLLLPVTRAKAMIKDWTLPEPVGDLQALSPMLANTIDNAIQQWMYPTALNHEGFIKALQSKVLPVAPDEVPPSS